MANLYNPGDRNRAVSISDEADSGATAKRSAFRRDYGRLLHSPAFRRLQAKTQLFPSDESDYFRNRLTHSLEVAQVAKAIAAAINIDKNFRAICATPIDLDLVETISLAHDLGHPPFGHNGEEALDECMKDSGGFEGNAQTLRILSCLEKRDILEAEANNYQPIVEGVDKRVGLNLTYRTLAGVLKYDYQIPTERLGAYHGPIKGYYATEQDLVENIRTQVGYSPESLQNETLKTNPSFRTIECSIMDIADDIAYSIYDLDDTFKAGFLDPITMLAGSRQIVEPIVETINRRIKKFYPDKLDTPGNTFSLSEIQSNLLKSFPDVYRLEGLAHQTLEVPEDLALAAEEVVRASKTIAANGYFRHGVTSSLMKQFLAGVEVLYEPSQPSLSRARLKIDTFKQVEVLKNYTFYATIMSPRMRVLAYRGKKVVKEIFHALRRKDGWRLMPEDVRSVYDQVAEDQKKRVICDFVAGMTDRYAIEFHNRLHSTNRESFYSPQ